MTSSMNACDDEFTPDHEPTSTACCIPLFACPHIALQISDADPFLSLLHLFMTSMPSIPVFSHQNAHTPARTSLVNGISTPGGAESVPVYNSSPYVPTFAFSYRHIA